ncbi:MAG: hypothetical protein Kow0090_11780 [Myxococcota bacterium]
MKDHRKLRAVEILDALVLEIYKTTRNFPNPSNLTLRMLYLQAFVHNYFYALRTGFLSGFVIGKP